MSSANAVPVAEVTPELEAKLLRLKTRVAELPRAVVAFSGGVDSAFLLAVAHEVLGDRVIALTAKSASMMGEELAQAVIFAQRLGVRHEVVTTREIDWPAYVENDASRCYHCKTELFDVAQLAAFHEGDAQVVDGFNADDASDHAQGHRAAREHGVQHPLADVDLHKDEIRALSRRMGLSTWNKPQLACLSSRIPRGMSVTEARLGRIEAVEMALRRLNFFDLRARLVRENDEMVRIEVGEREIARLLDETVRREIVSAAHQAGFHFVTLDLEGFASGRLSQAPIQIGRRSTSLS